MQDIYIDDKGEGYPIVLVHGFLGSSEMWSLQKKYLKNNFRLISPALPGFGESHKAKSLNSINSMAKFILKCVDKKKINKFNLIGHSMGGMIAQEIIKISNKRVKKAILFATGPIGEIPGRFESIDNSILKIKREGIKKSLKRIPQKWFVKGKKAKYFFYCKNAARHVSKKTAIDALIAMKKWNGLKNLKKINIKVLIIWGDKDLSYNIEQINLLKKNISQSKLNILKNCGHNVHLEKPQKFNNLVMKYFK